MKITCAYCGKHTDRHARDVNRSRKFGWALYCDRACAGKGRRSGKTAEQKKVEKRDYDAKRRTVLAKQIKAKKAEYHKRTYDPEKAAVERKKRMPWHVEYCRRPEYRAWKKDYDRQYRARKRYGAWADAFLMMMDLNSEIRSRACDYDIRVTNKTLNKKLERRRDYEKSFSNKP